MRRMPDRRFPSCHRGNALSKLPAAQFNSRFVMTQQSVLLTLAAAVTVALSPGPVSAAPAVRPPSVPLVACDPYFSIWSPGDTLNGVDTAHWTGKPHRLMSVVTIDGKAHRVMGTTPADAPALTQTGLTVLPTRTIYNFEGAGVALTLTFLTPALPDDIDILSRPVTYVTYDLKATDGRTHEVAVALEASGEIAVNTPKQEVVATLPAVDGLAVASVGSKEQPVLGKRGDDIRIDWGYLYLAANRSDQAKATAIPDGSGGAGEGRALPAEGVRVRLEWPAGSVGAQPVSRWLMLAYDDLYSIQYMRKNLRPYWRRRGWEAADLLLASAKDYASLRQRCEKFDEELMADVRRAGGESYAQICALAYRQCFAAGKFVADDNGQPLQFCKENHSNGCIGTSDVFYPMAPQFLLFGPTLAKSFVVPFMNYAASARWKFPFAPHDLGTYPKANGQVYGDGERGVNNQMPVEESGNLLLLFGAIAQMEGKADFAGLYWKQLEQWAGYLKEKGFDPENQLCTDDFAGHLAHNVNLSAKAICGLGAFAKLCEMRGDRARAEEYFELARGFAARWVKEAADGDHYRLAFDKPGSWSQKYNLIWDRILGLKLFPAEVLRKEMDYYRKMQNRFGLPLDNRKDYTKLDWITWTATLTGDRADFEALVDPILRFINETPNRAPLSDWYETRTPKKVGFTARPVIGGVFARMLYERDTWARYAGRDQTKATGWAPMPEPPSYKTMVPAADREATTWRYTTQQPGPGWMKSDFDDAGWQEGRSGFGTSGTPGARVGTPWNTADIWLRRTVDIPAGTRQPQLWLHHDEDAEIYINGVLAASAAGYVSEYDAVPLTGPGGAALKPGSNVIAVHCRQTRGGQYIDVGLVE